MSSGSNIRYPFTASQWQELEHQALIFKYMVSGIPIPPDLLFTIKRSFFDSPLSVSPKLFPHQHQHQHQHIGSWNCFQIGLGRKIDPEPGRCRRTDGKKWRCSKEAYPDSKYCERHMHRGKNRSRKPVEVEPTTTAAAATTPSSNSTQISSLTKNSSHSLQHQLHYPAYNNSHVRHSFLYSSKPQETFNLNSSASASHTNTDNRNRYVYGLKEEVDEHAFFSEPSGNIRSFSASSMDDSWQFTPLTISSSSSSTTASSSSSSKQRSCSGLQSDYSYLQLQSLNDHTPKQQDKQDQHFYVLGSEIDLKLERQQEEAPQKTVHRFFDEWPPKTRDSWLDLDDKSSNTASVSTTRLSISIPSAHDFPIFSSRAP
ncbi:Growth-regulating factor-like protein [Melia azedarach]|uniref:Growth-regulating factor-like protein n=1 Tax=Melia azedarach TaxID=155640 RepID=A0ACC1XCD3_MELAZ|nr:Growth-regulating factor-like protein [Melia azedarach]